MSASCSMEPESLKSESCGRWSVLCSLARESCDSVMTGTSSSLAIIFRFLVISEISCTRLSVLLLPAISCR